MKDFLFELAKLRSDADARRTALAKKYGVPVPEFPIGALGMILTFATTALEHASHYDSAWAKLSAEGLTEDEIASIRKDNGDRLMIIGKTMFVWCMSSVEYAMKT